MKPRSTQHTGHRSYADYARPGAEGAPAARAMAHDLTVEDMLSLTAADDEVSIGSAATYRWSTASMESSDDDGGNGNGSCNGFARASRSAWTAAEDQQIMHGVRCHGSKWSKIAEMLPVSRTDDAVRNRYHRLQRKKQRAPVHWQASAQNAQYAPPQAGGLAAPAQYTLTAPPPPEAAADDAAANKHGDMWTEAEDALIDTAVRHHKLRWKAIAAMLPGRSESGCRNRWVRNMEKILAAAGVQAHGTSEVIAALHAAGKM